MAMKMVNARETRSTSRAKSSATRLLLLTFRTYAIFTFSQMLYPLDNYYYALMQILRYKYAT